MPINVVERKQTGKLTLDGIVRLKDGTKVRVQQRAASNDLALAREEAALLEARILRNDWHGEPERPQVHDFDAAIVKFLEAKPRSPQTAAKLDRLRQLVGGATLLSELDQDLVSRLRAGAFKDCKESTIARDVIAPLRAVLRVAAKRKWCDYPDFEPITLVEGRTKFFLPSQAEQLILAMPQHLKPLLIFLFCTGARFSEALYLDWSDVAGGRVILWPDQTKAKKRRIIFMPPRAVAALTALPHREGAVFRRPDGEPYVVPALMGGGQLRPTWCKAIERAGLDQALTWHSTRHTFATWHYALHRDPMLLKHEGGWASLNLVERYAHLIPDGYEQAIRDFLGIEAEQAKRSAG